MNPLLEKLIDEGLTIVVSGGFGYVGALFRLKRRFDRAEKALSERFKIMEASVDAIEERLRNEFNDLKKALGQGLHLELDTIREHVRSEVAHMRERLEDLRQMAEDLRAKSGDYTQEAELASFMDKVTVWMDRTNRAVGRLEGMLGAAKSAVTSRPPPMLARPVPKPPRPR